jgi:hypothetical protein
VTQKRWILAAAVLGSGIVFLDSTVVNVALPRIGRDLPRLFLGVLEGQSYVYNAYLLTLSALLILAGALSRPRSAPGGMGLAPITSALAWARPSVRSCAVRVALMGPITHPGNGLIRGGREQLARDMS